MTFPRPSPPKPRGQQFNHLVLGFLLLFGLLLSTRGPIDLTCNRTARQVDCTRTRFTIAKLLPIDQQTIPALTAAELAHVKQSQTLFDQDGNNHSVPRDSYGVQLIGQNTTLFNGYDDDQAAAQQQVDQINQFLQQPTQRNFTLTVGNPIATIGVCGILLTVVLLLAKRFQTKQ